MMMESEKTRKITNGKPERRKTRGGGGQTNTPKILYIHKCFVRYIERGDLRGGQNTPNMRHDIDTKRGRAPEERRQAKHKNERKQLIDVG